MISLLYAIINIGQVIATSTPGVFLTPPAQHLETHEAFGPLMKIELLYYIF